MKLCAAENVYLSTCSGSLMLILFNIVAELDRKVAEERRRLQEVREAVCRSSPTGSRACSPEVTLQYVPPPNPEREGYETCSFNNFVYI